MMQTAGSEMFWGHFQSQTCPQHSSLPSKVAISGRKPHFQTPFHICFLLTLIQYVSNVHHILVFEAPTVVKPFSILVLVGL